MTDRIPTTISGLLAFRAAQTPDDPLMTFRDHRWTWEQVRDQVQRLALGFQDAGLEPGDRLLGVFDRCPQAVLCLLATIGAGGVFVPINPQLGDSNVEKVLTETQPRVMVASPPYLPRFQQLADHVFLDQTSTLTLQVFSADLDAPDGIGNILKTQPASELSHVSNPDDIAYLNYTSGTTGQPKGAVTTHRHILENARSSAQALKLKSSDVHLCMFPIHTHPHEIFARPFLLGGSFVLLDSIHPRTIADAITRHRITCMMGVTPMYRSLLTVADSPDYDFSSLRIPESGGMDSPLSFIEDFEQTFGRRYLSVWGSTETSGIAIATPPIGETLRGSLGRPCPGYQVKLVTENGDQVEGSGEGELWVKGTAVVEKYWDRPDDTRAAFKDGWYCSGDIMRREDGGFYTFQGRMNGMMKVGGMKVFPLEIERVLCQHPSVEEAVVVGIKDRMRGETPKAFVVPAKGTTLSNTDLRKHCQGHLPGYKVPRRYELRRELPRAPGGKVLRSILLSSENAGEHLGPVSDLQEKLINVDRRILSLLNRRSRLLEQEKQRDNPIVVREDYIQRVLDANEGPLYDDVAERLLKQIHSTTKFPGGK
jgi:long-chain acyl-CoA synthetase